MIRTLRVPIACALVALLAAWVVLRPTLEVAQGRPSLLVRMAAEEPMADFARAADPMFAFVPRQAHYDGVYFYAIALDPLALGAQHAVLTQPAYRYRGPLYGWLAGAVGLGQASLMPWSLLIVNLVAFAAAAALVGAVGVAVGRSAWLGLVVALNPGFLISLTVDTAEPVAMALIATGMLAWLGGRRWAAALALTGAAFAREVGALVAVGIALHELAAWLQAGPERTPVRALAGRVAPLAVAPLAYLGWWAYLRMRMGAWPTFEPTNLAVPPTGPLETLGRAARMALGFAEEMQLGVAMVAILGAGALAMALGLLRALRLRTVPDGALVGAALLVLSLNWWPTLYPKEMVRNFAIASVLLALSLAAVPVAQRAHSLRSAALRRPL